MTSEPVGSLVAAYSEPDATAVPWADVAGVLESSEMFWLSTVRSNGRPHVAPLPAMWRNGNLHFCTGAEEQKAKNIAANPDCVLTTGSSAYRSGLDVVVEGPVVRVVDNNELAALARMWKDKLDWTYDVGDGVFLQTEAELPALVFALRPAKILAFKKAPYSQTRFVLG